MNFCLDFLKDLWYCVVLGKAGDTMKILEVILSISLYTIFSKSSIFSSAPISTKRSEVDIGADAVAQV